MCETQYRRRVRSCSSVPRQHRIRSTQRGRRRPLASRTATSATTKFITSSSLRNTVILDNKHTPNISIDDDQASASPWKWNIIHSIDYIWMNHVSVTSASHLKSYNYSTLVWVDVRWWVNLHWFDIIIMRTRDSISIHRCVDLIDPVDRVNLAFRLRRIQTQHGVEETETNRMWSDCLLIYASRRTGVPGEERRRRPRLSDGAPGALVVPVARPSRHSNGERTLLSAHHLHHRWSR